jgi:hypothetical protein
MLSKSAAILPTSVESGRRRKVREARSVIGSLLG